MAKLGIALGSGPRGRGFESRHSDQIRKNAEISKGFRRFPFPWLCAWFYSAIWNYQKRTTVNYRRPFFHPQSSPVGLYRDNYTAKKKAAVFTNGEGNVGIELDGENALKSGKGHAGLEKLNSGSLTIADKDKNGKLAAEGSEYGAGIGGGGSNADGSRIPGAEVDPDISGLTTGRIEYYAPGADMEKDKPEKTTVGTLPPQEKPIDPGTERGEDVPLYRVTDRDGRDIAYMAEQTGGVLTVTVDEDFAILTGKLSGIRTLRAQGVEKIVFVTKGAASAFLLSDLLGKGESGEAYRLTHDTKAVTFTLGESTADVSAILTKP